MTYRPAAPELLAYNNTRPDMLLRPSRCSSNGKTTLVKALLDAGANKEALNSVRKAAVLDLGCRVGLPRGLAQSVIVRSLHAAQHTRGTACTVLVLLCCHLPRHRVLLVQARARTCAVCQHAAVERRPQGAPGCGEAAGGGGGKHRGGGRQGAVVAHCYAHVDRLQ